MTRNEEYKKKILINIEQLLIKYIIEYERTPFYHNTSNCILNAKITCLEILKDHIKEEDIVFDEDSVGCYLNGMSNVLDELKNDLIFKE